MIFREADVGDIRRIQVLRNIVKENRLSDPSLVTDKEIEDYLTWRGKGWLCQSNDLVVGFAIVSVVDTNVWALFTDPEYEGKGIGKKLHDKMMDWYFKQTNDTIWLGTMPGTRAERFYRVAGWKETGVYGKGEIKFEMTKDAWTRQSDNKEKDILQTRMLQTIFRPFPEIQTERLQLRQLALKDAEAMFFLRSDGSVLRFINKEPAKSVKEAEDFIRRINDDVEAGESILWAIELKEHPGRMIGIICFWQIRKEHYRAETGFVLHPEYWGKGIMKEALKKVIQYGFDTMGLHSIDAVVNAENKGSIGVLESTGFIREAYFREDFYFRGAFLDTAVYSLLNKSSN